MTLLSPQYGEMSFRTDVRNFNILNLLSIKISRFARNDKNGIMTQSFDRESSSFSHLWTHAPRSDCGHASRK